VPSINHEALVVLFENRPALAGELLRLRGVVKAPSPKMDGSARLLSTSVAEVDLRHHLRARYRCPVLLLVLALDAGVAQWRRRAGEPRRASSTCRGRPGVIWE
jgi:hypothetical protein